MNPLGSFGSSSTLTSDTVYNTSRAYDYGPNIVNVSDIGIVDFTRVEELWQDEPNHRDDEI